jgi:hypothetical protein
VGYVIALLLEERRRFLVFVLATPSTTSILVCGVAKYGLDKENSFLFKINGAQ